MLKDSPYLLHEPRRSSLDTFSMSADDLNADMDRSITDGRRKQNRRSSAHLNRLAALRKAHGRRSIGGTGAASGSDGEGESAEDEQKEYRIATLVEATELAPADMEQLKLIFRCVRPPVARLAMSIWGHRRHQRDDQPCLIYLLVVSLVGMSVTARAAMSDGRGGMGHRLTAHRLVDCSW